MQQNTIKLPGDGNFVIQDAKTGDITINQNDPQLFEKLQKLRNEDIAVLQKMINEQTDKFSELIKTMESGLVSQKNIVQGSISHVETVKIGDEIHYHYPGKTVNQNAEKIYNINKIDNANFS
mgnify:CR=1 FL=1